MSLQLTLQHIGLTEKEAIIYLALLQIGEGSILDIARHSGLKRPTIYSGIESLQQAQLIGKIHIGKRIHFYCETPKRIDEMLQKKREELKRILPELQAMINVPRGTKTQALQFSNKEVISTVFNNAIITAKTVRYLYNKKSLRILLSILKGDALKTKISTQVESSLPITKEICIIDDQTYIFSSEPTDHLTIIRDADLNKIIAP